MGKHKNAKQIEILLQFMEENPDLAKGYTNRNKSLVDSLWEELATSLNAAGPPMKQIDGWKKVWTIWKFEVKKKLSHNFKGGRGTGGGPFKKQVLTQSDEAVARICALQAAVSGVSGIALGVGDESGKGDDDDDDDDDDMPSCSSKRKSKSTTPSPPSAAKRQKPEPVAQRLSRFLDEDNENKSNLITKIDDLIKVQKEHASSFRRMYRANEAIDKSLQTLTKVSTLWVGAMQEKNEIEKKKLEIYMHLQKRL